jgi:ribosomal protein S18 acetylase RimI-like enzyme
MGILSEYRGMGIGTRLVTAAIEDALSKGITRIELDVYASNTRAIALYRKMGFVEVCRKVKARCLDGQYDGNIVMALITTGTEPPPPPRRSPVPGSP